MPYEEKFSIHMLSFQLFLLLTLIPVLDCNEICKPKSLQCQCGKTNTYSIHQQVKQCLIRHSWERPHCGGCKGEPSDNERCANYQNCLECDGDLSKCFRCPLGRYGTWCTEVCQLCAKGGYCHRDTGICQCTEGFTGPTCEESTSCSAPCLHIYGGKAINWTTKYAISSSVTYKCYDGYEIKGSPILHCLKGGVWSNQPPNCTVPEITCKLPPIPSSTLHTAPIGNQANLAVETRINFSCADNYVLLGEYSMTCQKDRTWSSTPPICVPEDQTCSHPGKFVNGDTKVVGKSSKNKFSIGTSIHFTCYQEDYYLSGVSYITCEINNNWSSTIPTCVKVISCPPIQDIRNGILTISTHISRSPHKAASTLRNRKAFRPRHRSSLPTQSPLALKVQLPEGRHHVGTTVSYSCISPYYNLEGHGVRKCNPSGEWSGHQPICNPVCGHSNTPRSTYIVNGSPSVLGQWPWQVAIAQQVDDPNYNSDWFIICGGTIVSESFVLTAAHCVTEIYTNYIIDEKEFQLYFGKYYHNDILDDEAVQKRFVAEIIVHPDYMPGIYDSDIALIRLESEIEYTSRVQQVCLPKESDDDKKLTIGSLGTVSGWGQTEDRNVSDELRHVQVPIISNEQCRKDYHDTGTPLTITANMMCAGYETGIYDACFGDSGGPLVFPKSSWRDEWVLEGIVSAGGPGACGTANHYGIYTRVRRFMPWIEKYIY